MQHLPLYPKPLRPVGIDLFAGAGGLSLGFEQAGVDVAAAVEIDPIHFATHEFNFPNSTAICASVVDLTGEQIRHRANLGKSEIGGNTATPLSSPQPSAWRQNDTIEVDYNGRFVRHTGFKLHGLIVRKARQLPSSGPLNRLTSPFRSTL